MRDEFRGGRKVRDIKKVVGTAESDPARVLLRI
jgi:hypothetical protein